MARGEAIRLLDSALGEGEERLDEPLDGERRSVGQSLDAELDTRPGRDWRCCAGAAQNVCWKKGRASLKLEIWGQRLQQLRRQAKPLASQARVKVMLTPD